ncbi:MAG: hypothetical protein HS111_13345 [Kofleriaceae bacterium]|nr:hypothetical protein [Kofleriaceae bacterium]
MNVALQGQTRAARSGIAMVRRSKHKWTWLAVDMGDLRGRHQRRRRRRLTGTKAVQQG